MEYSIRLKKSKAKERILRETQHEWSAIATRDESTKIATSFIDFLEIFSVDDWYRH